MDCCGSVCEVQNHEDFLNTEIVFAELGVLTQHADSQDLTIFTKHSASAWSPAR